MSDMTSAIDATGGILAGAALMISLTSMVIGLAMLFIYWRVFVKMGEPGWKALIPVYNLYVLAEHMFGKGWMCILAFIPFAQLYFIFKWNQCMGFSTAVNIITMLLCPVLPPIVFAFNSKPWIGY